MFVSLMLWQHGVSVKGFLKLMTARAGFNACHLKRLCLSWGKVTAWDVTWFGAHINASFSQWNVFEQCCNNKSLFLLQCVTAIQIFFCILSLKLTTWLFFFFFLQQLDRDTQKSTLLRSGGRAGGLGALYSTQRATKSTHERSSCEKQQGFSWQITAELGTKWSEWRLKSRWKFAFLELRGEQRYSWMQTHIKTSLFALLHWWFMAYWEHVSSFCNIEMNG